MTNKWHKRYIDLACNISEWSKDPSTTCGSVIVGDDGQVIAQGYNGFPRGMRDDKALYKTREVKYNRIVHAEMNAIYNAALNGVSPKNATMYVHGLPCCHECAKAIIQVGIKEIVMHSSNDPRWNDSCLMAKEFLDEAGVKVTYIDR